MKRKPWSFPLDDATSTAACSCEGMCPVMSTAADLQAWMSPLFEALSPRHGRRSRDTRRRTTYLLWQRPHRRLERRRRKSGGGTEEKIMLKENFTLFESIWLSKVPVNSGLRTFSDFLPTWGWVDNDRVFILGQTVPLNSNFARLFKNGCLAHQLQNFIWPVLSVVDAQSLVRLKTYLHVATFSKSLLDSFFHSLLSVTDNSRWCSCRFNCLYYRGICFLLF